jgi:uncharacterized protein involved in exopolysaccharide biosynthesis
MEDPLSDIQRSAAGRAATSRTAPGVADAWQAPAASVEGELDLSRYVRVLQRGWKFIVAGIVIGGLSGIGASLLRSTQYEAVTTISIENPNPQSAATFRALLQGSTIVADSVHELGLDQTPHNVTPQAFLSQHLQIEPLPGTNLVRVRVKLQDPAKAAAASRLLAGKAVELHRRMATTGTGTRTEQLKTAMGAAAQRLLTTETELLRYRSDKQVEVLKKDTDAMLAQRGDLLRLQIDIESEKARLASAEREIAKQQPVLEAPDARSDPSTSPSARRLVGESDAAVNSRAFLNPGYQALAIQIATSQTSLAALERQRSEAQARKLGGARFGELNELYRREIEMARLEGDYDVAKRVYGDLSLRYEQSKIETASGVVQIVDAAVPPTDPLPTRRLESIALGMSAGLLLSALATLVAASGRQPAYASVA